MSKPAFTKGPWSYDGKFTVGIPHEKGDTFFRTNPEDARLTSAAPELFEALEAIDQHWSEFWPKGPDVKDAHDRVFAIGDDTATIWKQIRTAFAKARGTS